MERERFLPLVAKTLEAAKLPDQPENLIGRRVRFIPDGGWHDDRRVHTNAVYNLQVVQVNAFPVPWPGDPGMMPGQVSMVVASGLVPKSSNLCVACLTYTANTNSWSALLVSGECFAGTLEWL